MYKPLDNEHQIREALQAMCDLINQRDNVWEKALLALLLISYIQPFDDGNKRTGRIVSNAILMYHRDCPLSFRTIDPIAYKKALLIFYERNNLSAFKKIFIEQYQFAVEHYF
jgi:Fic family protein